VNDTTSGPAHEIIHVESRGDRVLLSLGPDRGTELDMPWQTALWFARELEKAGRAAWEVACADIDEVIP
jgi:hypothetical protein